MKTLLFATVLLISTIAVYGQNINDNKISFQYTQLPLIKIKDSYKNYEVRLDHEYLKANEDSLELFELRQEAAETAFEREKLRYKRVRDSLDRVYLTQLAAWEKNMNAGVTNPNGTPLTKPNPPAYPDAPIFQFIDTPFLHSEYDNEVMKAAMKVEGFEQGLGGFMVTVTMQPLSNIRIIEKRKGTGTSTKYEYTAQYTMPMTVKVETPTEGVILEQTILEGTRSYKMKDQKSKYDHQVYMMDNANTFYRTLEAQARQQAINETNNFVNNQIGYVKRNRNTEIYSVKRFKNYDYSDVTNAYTATVQALSMVKNDRDRSGAKSKLENALKLWEEIMMESNTYDNKARINDKISAVIQCNIAEIKLWQSAFNEAEAMLNLAENSGVMKAKNHARRVKSYYASVKKRWEVNY